MADISFSRPMLYSPASSGDLWELAADWSLVYEGEVYRLPMGFKTDGASIPRFLWRLCGTPLEVPRLYAALVHDYLYGGGDPEATREDADKLYRDIQIALDVSKFKAYTEYYALRAFGGGHWHENEKGSEK